MTGCADMGLPVRDWAIGANRAHARISILLCRTPEGAAPDGVRGGEHYGRNREDHDQPPHARRGACRNADACNHREPGSKA